MAKKTTSTKKPGAVEVKPKPEPRWEPTNAPKLEAGDIIEFGTPRKRWFVVYVNESRARVVPLTATAREFTPGPDQATVRLQSTGHGTDISPRSIAERVAFEDLTDDEALRAARFAELELSRTMTADEIAATRRSQMAEVAEAPIPTTTKSIKDRNKERLAQLKAKGDKKKAEVKAKGGKVPGEKREKKAKELRPCACGCGGETTAYFLPGHDARFKGWLLKIERGEMDVTELPKSVQKQYTWKKKGDGVIPTTNYKGEPHTGYDK